MKVQMIHGHEPPNGDGKEGMSQELYGQNQIGSCTENTALEIDGKLK